MLRQPVARWPQGCTPFVLQACMSARKHVFSLPSVYLHSVGLRVASTASSEATTAASTQAAAPTEAATSIAVENTPSPSLSTRRKTLPPPGKDFASYLMTIVQEQHKPKHKRIHQFFPNISMAVMKGGITPKKGTPYQGDFFFCEPLVLVSH